MGNEKFVRALKAMKPLGLTSNDVSPVLKRLLKVYDNEWPLIEAESYRVLADAVFESREEQFESQEEEVEVEHKRKEGKRRGKRTVEFDDEYGDTESEHECEYEFVPPLTRARSALVNKPKNEEIVDVEEGFHGGNGVSIEEDAAEAPSSPPRRSSRLRIGSFASSVSASASASGQRVSSRLQNENEIEGRGKRIACENEIEIEGRGKRITCENEIEGRGKRVACEPPPLVLPPATSVLKKPKIEVTEDLEKYNYGGCFGTPIVEEIDESSKGLDDCQTSGELKKPEIERDGCTFPFPVMNVVPITAVNVCPEPSSDQNENSSDLEELQTDKKGREVQGVSVQFTSSLGAIAEAYMEMDIEEIPSTQFRPGKRETRLTIFNSKDNIQGEAKSSLDSNDFKGSGHMQSCTEYSICIDGSVHTPARLEYNNTLKGSDLAERSLDHSGGISGSNIPQPSIDMVLKMVEGYTLQSFKILAPDFPVMRLMEKFCQHILNSRNDRVCDEKQTEFVSMAPNLLTSGNETKVRRSPRIKPKTQEPSIPDKGKSNAETKDHASSSTMLVSLEPCQPSVDQSRPVHDLMDISRGEENIKIPITNELTSESYPSAFYYIPKSIVYQNAYINVSLARIGDDDCCSNCSGDCLESPITCACARETGGEYAYTRDGVLKKNFLEEALSIHMKPKPHHYFYCKDCPQERTKNENKPDSCKGHLIRKFVKECWSKCACSKHCGNRVVQRGIIRKLQKLGPYAIKNTDIETSEYPENMQVFFTSEGKGWGVRTLEDIPRGAFVCEYVGEILTNMELYNRNNERMGNEKHTYPVLLDADWCSEGVLKDEEALCLDATHYGNVARFINHRCYDANLIEIPVEVESPDRHYYHLAFFTTRKVEAMEELTWDYGIDFDDCDHPIKAFQCHCGSIHCRDAKRLHRRKTLHS